MCEIDQDVPVSSTPVIARKPSKRINQFRTQFLGWIDGRISSLDKKRHAAMNEGNWLYAGGLSMRLDELEVARDKALVMTR